MRANQVKRLSSLERASQPERERVFAVTGCDNAGRHYVGERVFESKAALEEAFTDSDIYLTILAVPDDMLSAI